MLGCSLTILSAFIANRCETSFTRKEQRPSQLSPDSQSSKIFIFAKFSQLLALVIFVTHLFKSHALISCRSFFSDFV